MPELRVLTGPAKGTSYSIGAGITTIGRAKTNSICIEDMEMSRQHAELHIHRDESVLVDLKSVNGSTINGLDVQRQSLKAGDQIRLGQTQIEFHSEPASRPMISTKGTIENLNDETRHGDSLETSDELLRIQSNLDVLYQSALAAGSLQNTQSLLQRILDLVFCWSSASRACILLREDDIDNWIAKSLDPSKSSGYSESIFQVNHRIVKHVFQTREGVLVSSVTNDKRFTSDSPVVSMEQDDLQIICAPIMGRNGMRGIIYADRNVSTNSNQIEDSFQDHQLKLMTAVGLHAAVAIESYEHFAMLLQSERTTAVGNALASLSHHVKNILQSINGGNHLIEAGIENQEFDLVRNGWRIVGRNQETLTQMVMDMLYFGKPISKKASAIEIDKLIECSIANCRRQMDEIQALATNIPPNLPVYWLDQDLVVRAIQNILMFVFNSSENQQPEPIQLSVEHDENSEQTVVSVRYVGSPLTESELETMFDLAKQSADSKRFGLGLAVARKILREIGSDVEIRAERENMFCFNITFETMHLQSSVPQKSLNR